MIELATPLIFGLQYWYLGWSELLLVRLIFSSAMVVLFVIDLQSRILPNIVTLPGIVVGLVAAFALDPGWESAILGTTLGGGGLLLVAETYHRLRQKPGVGMGDVKMLAMIGAFLGWQLMLMTLLLASLLGSVVGIGIIVSGRGDSTYALPFGSFLALAAVAASTTNVSVF
jgi:leader peptidase (prepilin peptidase)/N-methyltransferase